MQLGGDVDGVLCPSEVSICYSQRLYEAGSTRIFVSFPCRTDYEAIFHHLEEVRGSSEIKESFVCEVIKEAGKFKRKKLVSELEEWRTALRNCVPPLAGRNKVTSNR